MKMRKIDLYSGLKVRTCWKKKIYCGCIIGIPKIEAEKSAKLTGGRFISIPILTDAGKILQMPYTSRAEYEKLEDF